MSATSPAASLSPQAAHLPSSWIRAFELGIEKTRRNLPDLAGSGTTWSWSRTGDYTDWDEGFFEIGNWTTSFITGMGVLSWLATKDGTFLQDLDLCESLYRDKLLVPEHAANTMHDLGFLYSPYSVAIHQLTGDPRHRGLGLLAAETLAARFIPEGNYIRAWGRMDEKDTDWTALAIIDCLMNLPLLHWATEKTGDPKFRDIAIRHSDTTLEHFIREDDTVFHAYRFDPATGAPTGGDNYCGYGVNSHWARGTSWAIYGFALAYRHTGDERYLDASLRVARKFASLLDEDVVPVWDFRLPDDPALHIRDSSAAAVVACGIQELEAAGKSDEALSGLKVALIDRLCSPAYLIEDPSNRALLKHGQVGMAADASTSWGDYYLMEAIAREAGMPVTWW